jgi:hypothetical protein
LYTSNKRLAIPTVKMIIKLSEHQSIIPLDNLVSPGMNKVKDILTSEMAKLYVDSRTTNVCKPDVVDPRATLENKVLICRGLSDATGYRDYGLQMLDQNDITL